LICGAEHNLVVDARVRAAFVAALERQKAAVLTPDEARRFTPQAFDPRRNALRSQLVGQDAQTIAQHTGIRRPYSIRLLVVETDSPDSANPYAGEKLAPMLSMFTAVNEEVGLAICRTLLGNAGRRHTAIIHSRNRRLVEVMPASRILVNSPGSQGCCGMTTGLECSLTLGCGTFGGNSTTDNVSYRHLLNIKRIAHPLVTRQMEMEMAGELAR
jgi:acetaldehyde dehydrogenase / alcohol dehydrogenase